jgi:DNA helicase HerA-like ATPase
MPGQRPEAVGLEWSRFRAWFAEKFKPGQHLAVIAPTGAGKSTFVGGILEDRPWVLALDPKGGDSTLRALGYERLSSWPPPKSVYKEMEENGTPFRFIVGPVVNVKDDLVALKEVQRQALDGAFNDGGWTVYVDEAQIVSDRRLMGLAANLETLLIAARDKSVSVISSFQSPVNVPKTASNQASWIAVSYTRDTDVVNRLAEILGRPKPEIRGAMNACEEFFWLIVGKNPRMPIIVTRPDEIRPVRAAS